MNPNRGASGGAVAKNEERIKTIAIVVAAGLLLAIGAYLLYTRVGGAKEIATPSGLKYTDLVVGTGPSPQLGHKVSVDYVGKLENGTEFNNTKGQPMDFNYNNGSLIDGWIEGLKTMKVGGKRKLIVPPRLGYGATGKPGIPPNSTLIFEIELLGVK
jgi:FKBP-type peptidyl-prolyl cis-trans isomerase